MISNRKRQIYYLVFGPPMRFNAFLYRKIRRPGHGVIKAHLGPGKKNYLSGWVNVDANFISAKIDLWADLRNALPFRDGTVNAFYSHHVIEHLPDVLLPFHFREMHRCLKPGGVIRIGGPHGENAIRKYLEGDRKWFPDFPDHRLSIGGRLVNFIILRNEHKTLLTPSYLEEVATSAGFGCFRQCAPIVETNYPEAFAEVLSLEWEGTPDFPHTLIIEAEKPRAFPDKQAERTHEPG